jgi:signal transduction histidine kinase
MPFELRRNLFLAFKEMLHNAAKHAAASVVRIQIETASGKIVLSVTDNGCGFDPSVGFKGVGLPSLKSRAQSLGGHLEVESFPSAGTTIRFVIPCSISRPRFHSPKHLLKRFWSPV